MSFVGPVPLVAPYPGVDRETTQCVASAASYYQVPELLLHAILQKEGGKPGQAVKNRDGSYDLGPAQINTFWGRHFAQFNISLEQIRDDRCTNLYAASYILRTEVNHFKGDWVRAIIAYNIGRNWSASPNRYRIGYAYATDVLQRWHRQHAQVTANSR